MQHDIEQFFGFYWPSVTEIEFGKDSENIAFVSTIPEILSAVGAFNSQGGLDFDCTHIVFTLLFYNGITNFSFGDQSCFIFLETIYHFKSFKNNLDTAMSRYPEIFGDRQTLATDYRDDKPLDHQAVEFVELPKSQIFNSEYDPKGLSRT